MLSKKVPKRFMKSETTVEDTYAFETFKPVDPILQNVLDQARKHNIPNIHVGAMPGLHLEVMIRMAGYKKAVEIGTLAGFSGICIARGLGPDGILHTIDVRKDFSLVAQESYQKAGVADNVKVHVGTAIDVLKTLDAEGPFDVVFIDADKHNYPHYLKWAEQNVRVGGAVIGDNTFGWGMICEKNIEDGELEAAINGIRQFNDVLANSPRWRATILPTEQGLTLAVKVK